VPAVPVRTSSPFPPACTMTGTLLVEVPSDTVTVATAVPVRPDTVETVTVRVAPLPPKVTEPVGTSAVLEEVAVRVSAAAELSGSVTVRVRVPDRSSPPQLAGEPTTTVGGSLTADTDTETVTGSDRARPSDAR
jgi:hypothetical protein